MRSSYVGESESYDQTKVKRGRTTDWTLRQLLLSTHRFAFAIVFKDLNLFLLLLLQLLNGN